MFKTDQLLHIFVETVMHLTISLWTGSSNKQPFLL